MSYARGTTVPEDRSRQEIERLTQRYKASNFAFAYGSDQAMIGFEMGDRRVRFTLRFPKSIHRPTRHRGRFNADEALAQERRRLWRALALVVKAKMEAVESKVETFDQAFMAHIVMPDGRTVADHLGEQIDRMLSSGSVGPLLMERNAETS